MYLSSSNTLFLKGVIKATIEPLNIILYIVISLFFQNFMLKNLISLVFILIVAINTRIYADSNTKILPEPKPNSKILNFIKVKKNYLLPQEKTKIY